MGALLVLGGSLAGVACARANANGQSENAPSTGDSTQGGEARGDLRPLRPDELTDELMRASERILEQNADAPIGAEVPFSHGGRRYVARIEEHENTTNNPNRPPGKHKGVTVFTSKP
jgi:hypothetical protein